MVTPKRTILIIAGVAALFAFQFFISSHGSAAGTGNDVNPPPTIDINSVSWGDTDVSGWAVTANLSSVSISGAGTSNGGQDGRISFPYDKASVWPTDISLGFSAVNDSAAPVVATAWIFVHRNGAWKAATFDWVRPGQTDKDTSNIVCGGLDGTLHGLDSFVPVAGETYGFMVSGTARGSVQANVQERSNIIMQTWTGPTDTSNCNSGSGGTSPSGGTPPGGGPGAPPPVLPPIISGSGSEVDATPGWAGSLAFNPTNNTWLVVSSGKGDKGGTSKANYGRIMANNNKPITEPFRIFADRFEPLGPRAAYSKDINKYLVATVNYGDSQTSDGIWYGQFINPDGTLDGAYFKISQPGGSQLPTNSASLQYDSKNKKFVLVWENRPPGISAYLITIGLDKTIGPIIKVAADGKEYRAAVLAINEGANEYCVGYNITSDASIAKTGVAIAVRPVNAVTGQVGAQSIILPDAGLVAMAYNTQENQYLLAYTKPNGIGSYTKTLDSCGSAIMGEESLVQEGAGVNSMVYNPTSNTYALISQEGSSYANLISIIDSSGNSLYEADIFIDATIGNFAPVVTANTINGTYGATSSRDHATTRFIANLGSGAIFIVPPIKPFPPQTTLPVPSKGLPKDLGQLIETIFMWSLSLIGLVIFIRFFYAGFLWFTAAANAANVTKAKDIMKNAVLGTLVLFSAWIILNTINPDLVSSSFTLPGLPAGQGPAPVEGEAPPGAPPVSSTSCNQKFSVTPSAGCATISTCVDVSNYTPTHDCQSNGGICLLSSSTANRVKTFINSFNTLASGKSCTLKISSTLQVTSGPSVSTCHKPSNANSGTCADFNIVGNHDTCAPYFYQAAKDTGSVVSFLDEYVSACVTGSTTGGNIHVNF